MFRLIAIIISFSLTTLSCAYSSLPISEATTETKSIDGPYVFHKRDAIVVKHIELTGTDFKVKEKKYNSSERPTIVCTPEGNPSDQFEFTIQKNFPIPESIYKQPKNLLAISDIEGDFTAFAKLLKSNKVVDNQFNWTYGDGHLVLVGDFFDRGENVTAVLWLIYKLDYQAREHGGMVHFIIGNHEEMNLRGDVRYVRNKYMRSAKMLKTSYKNLYSRNTELGKWLRSKNIAEKIGNFIFVHGGLGPQMSDNNISLPKMNKIARDHLGTELWKINQMGGIVEMVMGKKGPLWYRGYFKKETNESVLDKLLQKYSAKHVVVGHTVVNEVSALHNGRVIAIDVKHKVNLNRMGTGALLVQNGEIFAVDYNGKKTGIRTANMTSSSKTNEIAALFQAIKGDDRQGLMQLLADKKKDINAAYSSDKYTLIHYAIKENKLGIVKALIEKGANLEVRYQDKTALMYAIKKNKMEIIDYLIFKGADINGQNSKNKTPLFYAAKYGNSNICKLLINKGANTKHRDYKGRTPAEYAAKCRNKDAAIYLQSL